MGGSLAGALKQNQLGEVVGVDVDPRAIATALSRGLIDRGAMDYREVVPAADVIILATPVRAIINLLPEIGKLARRDAIVTDLGSTKEKILEQMDGLPETIQAIGGHPMCGKFEAGAEHADAHLFSGKTFLLIPSTRTTPATLEVMEEIVRKIGGVPRELNAREHDELVALTSHLPRILPVALLSLMQKNAHEAKWSLAGGNLESSTSLATNNCSMWLDILLSNSRNLTKALGDLCDELKIIAKQIDESDEVTLQQTLQNAHDVWVSQFGK